LESAVMGAAFGAAGGAAGAALGRGVSRIMGRGGARSGTAAAGEEADGSEWAGETCSSFERGTVVATPKGAVPIERLTVGDSVWAYDEGHRATETSKVTATTSRYAATLLTISAGGGEVEVTPEHPLYEDTRGWVTAGSLRVGDLLRTRQGVARIERIVPRHGQFKVHNIALGDAHTYYTSGAEVLSHNVHDTCLAKAVKQGRRPHWRKPTVDTLFKRQQVPGKPGLIKSAAKGSKVMMPRNWKVGVGKHNRQQSGWAYDHISAWKYLLEAAALSKRPITWKEMCVVSNDVDNLRITAGSENSSRGAGTDPPGVELKRAIAILKKHNLWL